MQFSICINVCDFYCAINFNIYSKEVIISSMFYLGVCVCYSTEWVDVIYNLQHFVVAGVWAGADCLHSSSLKHSFHAK